MQNSTVINMTDQAMLELMAGLVEQLDTLNGNLAKIAKTLNAWDYNGAILHQARR